MSDKIVFSRNREDYPIDIQILLGSIAKVFRNGDVDSVWAEYLDGLEQDLSEPRIAGRRDQRAHLQLRFPPRTGAQ